MRGGSDSSDISALVFKLCVVIGVYNLYATSLLGVKVCWRVKCEKHECCELTGVRDVSQVREF